MLFFLIFRFHFVEQTSCLFAHLLHAICYICFICLDLFNRMLGFWPFLWKQIIKTLVHNGLALCLRISHTHTNTHTLTFTHINTFSPFVSISFEHICLIYIEVAVFLIFIAFINNKRCWRLTFNRKFKNKNEQTPSQTTSNNHPESYVARALYSYVEYLSP